MRTIAVAICTYNRNEPLCILLNALLICAAYVTDRARVGVVVVDDSIDGKARSMVRQYDGRFDLGITYCLSGQQNISVARNLAIETASKTAEWTAMIDDDCEPKPDWLDALLTSQEKTRADAVTGSMIRRVPSGSPKWLTEEPFLELGLDYPKDASELTSAATFNSMISSRWLREHPTIRFQPNLGVTGGEDMVFFRTASAAGLRIAFSERAAVYENQPPARATLSYQLRTFFWHGNSSYITSVRSGVHPGRMFLHGANSLRKALGRPIGRLFGGNRPQLRYSLALVLHAFGKMVGLFGVRIRH